MRGQGIARDNRIDHEKTRTNWKILLKGIARIRVGEIPLDILLLLFRVCNVIFEFYMHGTYISNSVHYVTSIRVVS